MQELSQSAYENCNGSSIGSRAALCMEIAIMFCRRVYHSEGTKIQESDESLARKG